MAETLVSTLREAEAPPIAPESALSRARNAILHTRTGRLMVAGAATAGFFGGELVGSADAEASYTAVGPELSHNPHTASRQFDYILEKTGPNGVPAKMLGEAFHINTTAGRKKYITPENIDLNRKVRATNRKYGGNTGSDGVNPHAVANQHPVSDAFTVVANHVSSKSRSAVHETASGKFELKSEVLRRICENLLKQLARREHPKHVPVAQHETILDVAFGVQNDLKAQANALSQSESSTYTEVTCGDGTKVTVSNHAEADALANAAAEIKNRGHLFVHLSGDTSFAKFKAQYKATLKESASAATQASTDTATQVECATPPQSETPPPPPPQEQTPPEVCTQKDFVDSKDANGNTSTNGSVNIGDTVTWKIIDWACNGSPDISNWNVKDVLPTGSTFLSTSLPLGAQVNQGTRTATWPGSGVLKADGTPVVFTFKSQVNADTPCYENLENDEWTTAVGGNTAFDNAYIKLNNTNPANNCPAPPSDGGPGQ